MRQVELEKNLLIRGEELKLNNAEKKEKRRRGGRSKEKERRRRMRKTQRTEEDKVEDSRTRSRTTIARI